MQTGPIMYDFLWWSFDQVGLATLISAGATILGGLIGVAALFGQIGRQAKHAVQQNKANEAAKLKLDIYRSILQTVEQAGLDNVELSSYLRGCSSELRTARLLAMQNQQYNLPSARWAVFSNLKSRVITSSIGVITVVERWHVIDSRMSIFQDAINSAIYDLNEACLMKFEIQFMQTMPMQFVENEQTLPWTPPSEDKEAQFNKHAEEVHQALSTLACYITDFQNEMQGLLVGGLFEGSVATRVPLDPGLKVIRLKDEPELRAYFRDDTPWGKYTTRLIQDVTARFNPPSGMTEFGTKYLETRADWAMSMLKSLRLSR